MSSNYAALAAYLDSLDMLIETAWSYELRIQEADASVEDYQNLIAVYFATLEPGNFLARKLDMKIVNAAYDRAIHVIAAGLDRFGENPELLTWRYLIRKRILYEELPAEILERLADNGSTLASVILFVESGRQAYAEVAQREISRSLLIPTARCRYIASFV